MAQREQLPPVLPDESLFSHSSARNQVSCFFLSLVCVRHETQYGIIVALSDHLLLLPRPPFAPVEDWILPFPSLSLMLARRGHKRPRQTPISGFFRA